jgi:UDP-3-O-[3-hydroxymyristoyl] N-acetylglucosamine deacetylase
MAALFALGIDNLIIELSGPEVPICDGSSLFFVEQIQKVGLLEQEGEKEIYTLDSPVYFSSGDMHLVALPSNDFRISYTLDYPQSPYLRSQYFSSEITPDLFCKEIAPCRTFTLYEDVLPLIQKGILKNADLGAGVVIDGEKVMNPEGVRFRDEMVRHKVLDLIGDIALLGKSLHVHLMGIKTGHAVNHEMARQLCNILRKK